MARRAVSAARRVRRDGAASLILALVTAALAALGSPSCLERRAAPGADQEPGRCATCHGDPQREGDYLERAAPPRDLYGQDRVSSAGVGAHAIHLKAGPGHAAVACRECHVVPERVDEKGHADDARPAEIHFGALARARGHAPSYDAQVQTCKDSYCHGDARPLWTEPRQDACGTCHGLPPPAPHPQSEQCSACHGEVIDARGRFLRPERHIDGVVDYAASECNTCHGSEDNAAPPRDTRGSSAVTALGVGAHQAHLTGGRFGRPLECFECHRVPEKVEEPTHVDAPPAEVALSGVAVTQGRAAHWDAASATCTDSWCHSPTPGAGRASPVWNASHDLGCASCHGAPPPAPHPQMTDCARCHAEVVGPDNASIIDRMRHVDGRVDVDVSQDCASCHGGANEAPPRDVAGNMLTTAPGVGAHQAHVVGTGLARPVPCVECHTVPSSVLAPGHVDTPRPAELNFSGVALAFGATPAYRAGSCQTTACHGAVFPKGRASGGTHTTPSWTLVDGTQAACGSCHGLPPPAPHVGVVPGYPCHGCHQNLAEDDVTFKYPELHVDGQVTLRLP